MSDYLTVAVSLLGVLFTLAVGLLGVSLRRQQKLRVAERRMAAYTSLWAEFRPAAMGSDLAFDRSSRTKVAAAMTTWYYTDGAGMFMPDECRNMFVLVRHNLTADKDKMRPRSLKQFLTSKGNGEAKIESQQQALSRDLLSLLRTRMKADLGEFGHTNVSRGPKPHEVEFLRRCGEKTYRRPWRERRHWRYWRTSGLRPLADDEKDPTVTELAGD